MGNKKWTIESIKARTREIAPGYECLSSEYINYVEKLIFKCSENHSFTMSWNKFRDNQRCPFCAGNRRKTIEEIKEAVPRLIFGYTCISIEYVDNTSKLEFLCNNGHIFSTSWLVFNNKKGCPICRMSPNRIDGTRKRLYRDRNWLYDQYINRRKSSKEIGKYCNVGHRLILSWIYRYGINTRSISESTTLGQYKDYEVLSREVGSDEKVCLKCKLTKRISEFRKASKNNDGLQVYCKDCHNSLVPKDNGWRKYTDKELESIILYRTIVKNLSNENYIKYRYIINPFNLSRDQNEYALDHIFSIQDGYENDVPVEIISSPINLRMLLHSDNSIKGRKSDISLEMLYSLHKQFTEEV